MSYKNEMSANPPPKNMALNREGFVKPWNLSELLQTKMFSTPTIIIDVTRNCCHDQ